MPKPALRFALAVLLAAPVLAGDIVVPVAANLQTVGTASYSTEIWVANPTNTTLSFTTRFIAAGTDGTQAPPASSAIAVAPGATVVLTGVAPAGTSGTLTIAGAPQLAPVARLQSVVGGLNVGISDIPLITGANAFAANAVAQLPGLQRINGSVFSDVFVYNLEANAASCTLRVLQSNGAQIGPAATVSLLPLERHDFPDTINILGISDLTDARIQVACDHKFYLAGLERQTGGQAAVVGASPTLAGSVLGGGGGNPPPTGDVVTFNVYGVVLNAVNGNSYKSFDLPAKQGQAYKNCVVEFDLLIRGFPEGLFTGVHSLRRDGGRGARLQYYGMQIVNRNSKTSLDLGIEGITVKGKGPWQSGHTYHVRITYDAVGRSVLVEVFENGIKKENLVGPAQFTDLSDNGNHLSVDFGMTGVADNAYVPPIGWQYSNLKVVLTP
jgi:hypothetical protein